MQDRYRRRNRRKFDLKVHVLLEYDTVERVCDIVKSLKQETTHALWTEHPGVLSQKFWKKRVFWSDGYFACSVGEASADAIRKYTESQG